MSQGILIVTNNKNKEQLTNCVSSLAGIKYPILIYTNDYDNSGYECAGLQYVMEYTDWEEVLLLQDTIEIKDYSFIEDMFTKYKDKTVYVQSNGFSYFNKYLRRVLEVVRIPVTDTKLKAVDEETYLHQRIKHVDKPIILFPELRDNPKREYKFGRENMIIENDYVKKYKGTWNKGMIR